MKYTVGYLSLFHEVPADNSELLWEFIFEEDNIQELRKCCTNLTTELESVDMLVDGYAERLHNYRIVATLRDDKHTTAFLCKIENAE